nr:MAG TPA: hypothetical protein [Caudoviricetes sp.]
MNRQYLRGINNVVAIIRSLHLIGLSIRPP